MNDFLELFAPVFFIFVAVILGIEGMVCTVDYLDCRGFRNGTGIETKWEWGCYAKVGERWVPKKYVFGDANELRIKANQ